MNPLVSIVTPSYNQAAFLEQTIRCVSDQTYPNIEHIVLDGGSTDGSVDVIKKYEKRLSYWHSRKDKGSVYAIEEGLVRSKGDIMAWLNSDDLLAPDAVQKAVAALQQRPSVVMVYGNRVEIDPQSRAIAVSASLPFLKRSPYISMTLSQESCFWRRDVFFQVGRFNKALSFGFDYDFFSKVTLAGEIAYVGNIWGFFRIHPGSKTVIQYKTVGKKDVASVQQSVWGKPVPRAKWLAVVAFLRAYRAIAGLRMRPAVWPNGVVPLA